MARSDSEESILPVLSDPAIVFESGFVTALLLAVLIAIPAAGALAMPCRSARLLHRILQVTVAVWLVTAFGWLGLIVLDDAAPSARVVIASLVELEAGAGDVEFSVELTSVRVGLLLSGLLLLLPTAFRSASSSQVATAVESPHESARLMLGILSAGAVALLCDNLLILGAAWLLLDSLLIRFVDFRPEACSADADSQAAQAAPDEHWGLMSVLRLSSVSLIVAVLLAASRYHSASLAGVIEAAVQDERVDAGMVRGGILVWFALAVACRAALFPVGVWLRPLADSESRDSLPAFAWAAVLPAVAVWLTLSPLLSLGPESSLLIAVLCGLSGVAIGMITLGGRQRTQSQCLLLLVIGASLALMSLSVPALAAGHTGAAAPPTGTLILLVNSAAIAMFSFPARHNRGVVLAVAVLISGLAGPNLLLGELQTLRHTGPTVTGPLEATATSTVVIGSGVVTGLWCSICATQLLVGAILALRLLGKSQSEVAESPGERTESVSAVRATSDSRVDTDEVRSFAEPVMIVLSVLSCVMLVSASGRDAGLGISQAADLSESTLPVATTSLVSLLSFNAATLSGLLGAVSAWLFLRMPVDAQSRLRTQLASPGRLARNWFYVGAAVEALRLLAGWVAICVELLDRKLLDGQRGETWRASPAWVGRTIEDVGGHGGGYPSLAALLAVVGLLLALAGFGR